MEELGHLLANIVAKDPDQVAVDNYASRIASELRIIMAQAGDRFGELDSDEESEAMENLQRLYMTNRSLYGKAYSQALREVKEVDGIPVPANIVIGTVTSSIRLYVSTRLAKLDRD